MKYLPAVLASLVPLAKPGKLPAFNFGPLGNIKVAKLLWNEVVRPGDTVMDATCGNGHDSLFLANICLRPDGGSLHCIDIQAGSIESTRKRLHENLRQDLLQRVAFHCQSHAALPETAEPLTLVVYNLGYLPGPSSDKSLITAPESTIASVQSALQRVRPGGMVSVSAYPGHDGGKEETTAVLQLFSSLDARDWRVYSHSSLNNPRSAVLINAFKIDKS